MDGVAKMVLNDFLRGKIPWFSAPPKAEGEEALESKKEGSRDEKLGITHKRKLGEMQAEQEDDEDDEDEEEDDEDFEGFDEKGDEDESEETADEGGAEIHAGDSDSEADEEPSTS